MKREREQVDVSRRKFLEVSGGATLIGALVAAGILKPSFARAEWNRAAFEAKTLDDTLKALGAAAPGDGKDIVITAPDIAENGAAYDDVAGPDGRVRDADRSRFIKEHIEQIHRALTDGVDIRGYLAWSLLDNFEWAFGLSKRFGIIRVDFDTLKRTPKDSYYLMQKIARENAI